MKKTLRVILTALLIAMLTLTNAGLVYAVESAPPTTERGANDGGTTAAGETQSAGTTNSEADAAAGATDTGEPTESAPTDDELADLMQQEEERLKENDNKVWIMDEEGNLKEEEIGDGYVDESGLRARAAASQVVNFAKITSRVINYTDQYGVAGYTHGSYGADAAYLGTDSSGRVRFMLSGVIGYVAAGDVQVISTGSAKSLSYYQVSSNGYLYHYVTGNLNNTSYSSINVGKKPGYLSTGTKYYSYDGHYFYTNFDQMSANYQSGTRTNSVNSGNPYYNYFQFLPLRSKTNHTAAQLSTAINNQGSLASGSKMYNIGSTMITNQNSYGVNALLMAGVAANESAWGKSNIAQTKNNLFGMNAVDSSPGQSANYYASAAGSVKDFAETYMSKQYLNPTNWKYFGAFLGNKASGINVKYASDPYWGEKAAAHAWNMDRNNGSRDMYRYTFGIKSESSVNVRSGASTSTAVVYTAKARKDMAFLILNKTPTSGFYKIQSEPVLNTARTAINSGSGVYDHNNMYSYISSSYVSIANNGQNVSNSVGVPASVTNAVSLSVHVQNIGDMEAVANGVEAGTTGENLRLESFKLTSKLSNVGVEYNSYVGGSGWQGYKANGAMSGTSGQAKKLEAVRIRLTGSAAGSYDVYYRVHVSNIGWLGWAESDDMAGTYGYGNQIEALQVAVMPRGTKAPGTVGNAYRTTAGTVYYSAHVQDYGWQGNKYSTEKAGTEGQAKRVEALKMNVQNISNLGVQYSAHVQDIGWQEFKTGGNIAGTTGQKKRVEAIKIQLTGSAAANYDIYYRVHAQDMGWLAWTKNGSPAGTERYGYRLERIQVQLVKKGESGPSTNGTAYYKKLNTIQYQTHVQSIGWQASVIDGATSGTTGSAKRLEAFKLSLPLKQYSGGISYRGHVQNIGWQSFVSDGSLAGTTGQSKRLEAVQIKLTGTMADYFDVYYRAHAQDVGWLGWAKNGASAGTSGYARRLEALQIRLVEKGGTAPGGGNAFLSK